MHHLLTRGIRFVFNTGERVSSITLSENRLVRSIIRFPLYILCFFTVLFAGQSTAFAQSNEDLINRIRARYDTVELLRADFTQQTTSPFGEKMPVNQGTLILEGDNYRVETEVQTFVTDGETTWVYDTYQNQVIVNNFVKDEASFTISDFLDNFHTDYEILETSTSYINGTKHHRIRLNAISPSSFFKEVTINMRDSDNIITRLNVLDVNDASLDFNLDGIELNPAIEGDPFSFIPPDGAEIIDLRS